MIKIKKGKTGDKRYKNLNVLKGLYPEKFVSVEEAFKKIHAGHRIFIGTGCGEPQHLVKSLIEFVEANPKAFFDAEILQVWTLGVAPYSYEKLKHNFRHNSFFISSNVRDAINKGLADYTPIFLSEVPDLFRKKRIPLDVALIQVSLPDRHGYFSLGISVDIVKVAAENASLVIAQVNSYMPRVHGETFLHASDVDFIIHYDEPLLEYETGVPGDIAGRIGKYVARIVQDGDTIQVGYGSIPNAILNNLSSKKDLGVHTEFLSDGIVDLMKRGVVNNSCKTLNRGKTVAAFCMGKKETYAYLDDNPAIEFRGIDYTNNPLNLARIRNMVAVNGALEIDLTGQATAESIGKIFYSGVGGQTNFMRGAVLASGGKSILVLESTADNGQVSRIVPLLKEGAGVTLTRGDIHYVVTEYGIAYLHGKNIRERAMSLIAIAHPRFRSWLIEEGKKLALIYPDQEYVPGEKGEYPEHLETYRTTKSGLRLFLRPVKISDEPLLKDFFYSLSHESMHRRFISFRKDMPHEILQKRFIAVDYTREMIILAVVEEGGSEKIVGIGQYAMEEGKLTAEIALVVRDEYHNMGVGTELLAYLTYLAKKQGLHGFTGETLKDSRAVFHLFEKMGFDIQKKRDAGVYILSLKFRDVPDKKDNP